MTLIKSISGIRGTIGGSVGNNLTPVDTVKFAAAYGSWLLAEGYSNTVVIGRDARLSGDMISSLIAQTLSGLGINVIDLGLSTTPSVEWAVPERNAGGGIIITASHNPIQWNALKLLNNKGEFLSGDEGAMILERAEKDDYTFAEVTELGKVTHASDSIDRHIEAVLSYPLVDRHAIANAGFKVAVDAVNSTGGIAVPQLLEKLGVQTVAKINCEPTGHFAHNPEPLPENLGELSKLLAEGDYDLGIVVDPDVDRLALLCEDGSMFGEEYTLVAVSDYILSKKSGNTVSNLSSTRALRDVTQARGGNYAASAVGEVNVVVKMKETNAVIGGEGNGGIIVPDFHYGRDSLIGVALFLTHLAQSGKSCSELRASYPHYAMSKNKIELTEGLNVDQILNQMSEKYSNEDVNLVDGVKIDFAEEWVHLRKSNTEPIIRIYAESKSGEKADELAGRIISDIKNLM